MINKIASEVLKASSIQQMGFCKVIVDEKPFSVKEALDTAVKVLEQEPCKDCISRKSAIDAMIKLEQDDIECYGCAIPEGFNSTPAIEALNSLPSVAPKEKTGKWIEDANKIDAQFGRHTYICSECGKYAEYFVSGTEVWWDRIKPNFCPNCGAKMEVSE